MVTRCITSPGVRVSNPDRTLDNISGTLFNIPRLSRSLVLVNQDDGQGASRVSVRYIGHVKESTGLFEKSFDIASGSLVSVSVSLTDAPV